MFQGTPGVAGVSLFELWLLRSYMEKFMGIVNPIQELMRVCKDEIRC